MWDDIVQIGPYEVTRIVTGGRWRENCYLVKHLPTMEMLLVDPGDDAGIINDIVNQSGILKLILLTHAHHDHIGAVKQLCQSFDVIPYLNKLDARLLRQAPMYAFRFAGRMVSVPDRIELYENLKSIPFADCLISIISTPGHTQGSVCYSLGDFIFTGDTLLYEHVGRTDLPGGSEQDIVKSVTSLLSVESCKVTLFPGHGKPWTLVEAKTWWKEFQGRPPKYNKFE